jgi:hypothetical protein
MNTRTHLGSELIDFGARGRQRRRFGRRQLARERRGPLLLVELLLGRFRRPRRRRLKAIYMYILGDTPRAMRGGEALTWAAASAAVAASNSTSSAAARPLLPPPALLVLLLLLLLL